MIKYMSVKTLKRVAVSKTPLIFRMTLWFVQALNFLVILGIGLVSPQTASIATNVIHLTIGAFLIWNFSPIFVGKSWYWERSNITEFEHNIIFSAGVIMVEMVILSTAFNMSQVQKFVQSERNTFKKLVDKILTFFGIDSGVTTGLLT